MRMTNCKNCGAPLVGGKCEYCGTECYCSLTNEATLHMDSVRINKKEMVDLIMATTMLTPDEARKLAGLREI